MGLWSSIVAVAGVVAAPFTGGASLYLTAAALVAPKVVDKAMDFAMKAFGMDMAIPGAGAAGEAERQQGVLVQRQGSVVNIPVVYGYRKVGSIVTYAETGSTDNKYLWVAHVLSEGEVAGLVKIFIDDNQLPDAVITKLNTGVAVDVDSGKYNGRMRLQFFPGVYSANPASSNHPTRQYCFFNNDPVKPPSWTTDMVYNGLAVIFARYEFKKVTTQAEADAQPYSSSIPSMSVELLGKKVSAVPAAAPANEYDADTTRYNIITTSAGNVIGYSNPVEAMLDYMRNPRYGKGLKNADIDWASWHVAAEKCATEVTYANGIKGPIMSCNYVLETGNTIFNNVKSMLSNYRGYMPYVQGRYKMRIEDAGHATDILSGSAEIVASFDKTNIMGDITYTGIDRSNKYNQVVVTWVDPDNKWSNQEVVYPETEAERQYYVNLDGNRENKGTFTAAAVTNAIMAKDLARVIFMKSRLQDTISLTVSSQGIELEPGDNIHVSGNMLAFANVYPWRVISTQLNNDMTVTLGCVFNPDAIYPYTRWTEPDRVLPVYVPRGAERYYPAISAVERNGLLPPYPGKYTSSSPIIGLMDSIFITNVNFVSLGTTTLANSDNIYADVTFNQPNTALYSSTKFYWKEDVASAETWAEFESLLAPGANQSITVRLGPVVFGRNYVINTRVAYQGDQISGQLGVYNFTVGESGVIPTAAPGTPTAPPAPSINYANDAFASITGATLLTAGAPRSPRQVEFTILQDMSNGTSSALNAVDVFWKPSANTKWSFLRTYMTGAQGDAIKLTLDCGVPVYPLIPGTGAPATVDDYDFIFRWAYSDGRVSNYQYRAMNCSIEWSVVTHAFNPLTTGTVTAKETTDSYTAIIATAADIVETRGISINVYAIKYESSTSIRLFVSPPVATDFANWVGVRVYRHRAGVAGTGDYLDVIPAHYNGASREYSVVVTGVTLADNWEYVVVPLVYYGTTTAEAFKGQYVRGAMTVSGNDQITEFRVDAVETMTTALAKRGTAPTAPPARTTQLASASISTVLTSGHPTSPRKLAFTMQQSTVGGTNGHISSVIIYYKQSDATYWKKSRYTLTGYTEGSTISFNSTNTTPAMDLAYPSYPTFPGREQNYDFQIRFGYDDGSESTVQTRITGRIEDEGLSTAPDYVITLAPPYNGSLNDTATLLISEDQAPAGAVLDIRDAITSTSMPALQLYAYTTSAGTRSAKFYFGEPVASIKSYLAGFRILRRPVTSGANPDFIINDANMPFNGGGIQDNAVVNGVYYAAINAVDTGFDYLTEYEWAIIPMVWYQGAKTEATQCLYWRGRVTDLSSQITSLPYTNNWFGTNPPQLVTTAGIRDTLKTQFPETDPVARVQSITRTGSQNTDLGYHTIKYQVPGTFVSATIYRRSVFDYNNIMQGSVKGKYYDRGNFYGAGRWEKISINNAVNTLTLLPDGSKTQTVNLRSAIYNEFNDKMNPTLAKWTGGNSVNTQTLYTGFSNTAPGDTGSPYATTQLLKSQYMATQLFIVISYTQAGSTVVSSKGVRVDLYDYRYINGQLTYNAPGVIPVDCTVVSTADMETAMDLSSLDLSVYVTASDPTPTVHSSWTTLNRKMSEGRSTPVPNNKIMRPGQTSYSVTYVPPTTTPPIV